MRKLLSIILSLSLFAGNALASFPDGWGRRAKIIVHATNIDADLTNWTMILTDDLLPSEMLDADGSYPALNGGGDIRISTNTDGTGRRAIDVRTFTTNNDPAAGVADIAINLPNVLTTGATFYVWWSSAGATQPAVSDTYGQYNAYDGSYRGVWDLKDNTTSTTNNRKSASYHGTKEAANNPSETTGKIGQAQTFNGTTSHIDMGNMGLTSTNEGTMSAVARFASIPGGDNDVRVIIGTTRKDHTNNEQVYMGVGQVSSKYYFVGLVRTGATLHYYLRAMGTELSINTWYHFGFTHVDGEAPRLHVNGVLQTNTLVSGDDDKNKWWDDIGTAVNATIGSNWTAINNRWWHGIIDEGRLSTAPRSTAWIKAEYVNLMTPTTFATAGTPETPGGATPSTFTPRRVIIVE